MNIQSIKIRCAVTAGRLHTSLKAIIKRPFCCDSIYYTCFMGTFRRGLNAQSTGSNITCNFEVGQSVKGHDTWQLVSLFLGHPVSLSLTGTCARKTSIVVASIYASDI